MNAEIDAINQILPNTPDNKVGRKGRAVQRWTRSVLHKFVRYNTLTEAITLLVEELALWPQEIVFNNVLPFLELPSYTFAVEEQGKLNCAIVAVSICLVFVLLLKFMIPDLTLSPPTNPQASVMYRASDMIFNVHSDASYLNEPNGRSRVAGFYFLYPSPFQPNPSS
jgi:hypothetical protein